MQDTRLHQTTGPAIAAIKPPSRFNRKTVWGLLLLGGIVWSLAQTGLFQREIINGRGAPLAWRFVTASINPDLSSDFLWLTLDATLTTLAFAVGGTFLSLLIGVGGGIIASEMWWETCFPARGVERFGWRWYRAPWLAIRTVLAVIRAIHEIIWGLFFVNIIGLDPLTAILAIAIPFGAVTAKVFSEILDETPRQALTALRNSGVTPAKAFLYTLLPQAFRDWLAYGFYRFECSIRAAAVLGIIGAGGLGHEIFLSLKTLKYEQIWTLFFALFLLNGMADFWSGLLRRRLGAAGNVLKPAPPVPPKGGDRTGDQPLGFNDDSTPSQPPPARGRSENLPPLGRLGGPHTDPIISGSLLLALILIPFSFWYVNPDLGKLFSGRSLAHLNEIVRWSIPPDFGLFSAGEWLELSGVTIAMSLLATAGAGGVSLFLSFPAANNFLLPGGLLDSGGRGRWHRWGGLALLILTRAILLIARSIPPPIWALICLFVLFPGILPGAVALGLYTLGVLGRLMAEVVENLDERPLRALQALGATGGDVFAYGVLPATTPRFIAYFLYRWEETIRATVVIGLVGAGGLGRVLTEQLVSFNYPAVLSTLIIFIILIFSVDVISGVVRRAYRTG